MALVYKPHKGIVVKGATEAADPTTLKVSEPTYGATATVDGQITPTPSKAVYEDYGIILERPHRLLVDVSSVMSALKVGSRIIYRGRTFAVAAPPRLSDALGVTDHIGILLEELSYVE